MEVEVVAIAFKAGGYKLYGIPTTICKRMELEQHPRTTHEATFIEATVLYCVIAGLLCPLGFILEVYLAVPPTALLELVHFNLPSFQHSLHWAKGTVASKESPQFLT